MKPYKITNKKVEFDQYYGISSVPITWEGFEVKITGTNDMFVVHKANSGWLLKKIAKDVTNDNRVVKVYGGEKTGFGYVGYESKKLAVQEGYKEILKEKWNQLKLEMS